jgi:hypothetical protein
MGVCMVPFKKSSKNEEQVKHIKGNIVHLHPVAHRYFTFTSLVPSLCGLIMFKTLNSVFNTCHFIKSLKHYYNLTPEDGQLRPKHVVF